MDKHLSDIFDPVIACEANHPQIDRWNDLVNEIAPTYNVPPNLVKAFMVAESGGDPNVVGGSGRGLGLMQIDYGTAQNAEGKWFYAGPNGTTYDIFDPRTNILIACRDFIAPSLRAFPHNLDAVVAAYNAGDGAVATAILHGRDLTSVTFAPWYIPRVTAAFSYFNTFAHNVA